MIECHERTRQNLIKVLRGKEVGAGCGFAKKEKTPLKHVEIFPISVREHPYLIANCTVIFR